MSETSAFKLTKAGMVFIAVALFLVVYFVIRHFQKTNSAVPVEAPLVSKPIDDQFWLNLDRRRSDRFRAQLKAAPQALVIRESHYAFNPTNGIGAHYGWLDGRLADLHISLSELIGYAYGKDYAHTEFPQTYTQGHWTNDYDVICTLTNRPKEAFQAAAKKFLKQQYGLSWRIENKNAAVLLIRLEDRQLLEAHATKDFARSTSLHDLTNSLENYFNMPVINETGATSRYDKSLENVPSRWVNGRTTNLDANNKFLAEFGLELIATNRTQKWLVLDGKE